MCHLFIIAAVAIIDENVTVTPFPNCKNVTNLIVDFPLSSFLIAIIDIFGENDFTFFLKMKM